MAMLTSQLEDELGDVLEKALRHARLSLDGLAARSGVDRSKLADALDYRYEFTQKELYALAAALKLNEVGLCAIAQGCYPLPHVSELPFLLNVLRMPFGAGTVNAYIISHPDSLSGILFDGGLDFVGLTKTWPRAIQSLSAVFLTHAEGEHLGGMSDVLESQHLTYYHGPRCKQCTHCREVRDGEEVKVGGFLVRALRTPGHAAEHNSYYVRLADPARPRGVLIAGDLIFAGSLGGGYFCSRTLLAQALRVLSTLPADTVIAPGHGPITTIEHERTFNPFIV